MQAETVIRDEIERRVAARNALYRSLADRHDELIVEEIRIHNNELRRLWEDLRGVRAAADLLCLTCGRFLERADLHRNHSVAVVRAHGLVAA